MLPTQSYKLFDDKCNVLYFTDIKVHAVSHSTPRAGFGLVRFLWMFLCLVDGVHRLGILIGLHIFLCVSLVPLPRS